LGKECWRFFLSVALNVGVGQPESLGSLRAPPGKGMPVLFLGRESWRAFVVVGNGPRIQNSRKN